MNIETTVAWVKFEHPIFNASGPDCTTWDDLEWLGKSESSGITMKSCSLLPREWNPSPRYEETELWSINSMWLPNLGYETYIEFSKKLQKYNKPIITSVVWFKWWEIAEKNDFMKITQAFQDDSGVDLIEVNLSCPNVVWKPQLAYDFEDADYVIWMVESLGDKPIGLKLPPYFDPAHTEAMAKVILKHPNVKFLTCINSVWNTLIIDSEKEEPLIKPKGWFGWLGWDYVKPVALANVRAFYKLLWDKVDIIWVWGIKSWIDVFDFLLCWAKAVQIGTVYSREWVESFARIKKEFEDYLEKKWYNSCDDFIWKLKEL